MDDLDLFTFKGDCLTEADLPRLDTAARRIWDEMLLTQSVSGGWCELNDLAHRLDLPHSSVTACVRGFRFDENGGHTVERIRAERDRGTFLYRLIPNTREGVAAARERAAAARSAPPPAYTEGYLAGLLAARAAIIADAEARRGWILAPRDCVAVIDHVILKQNPPEERKPEPWPKNPQQSLQSPVTPEMTASASASL